MRSSSRSKGGVRHVVCSFLVVARTEEAKGKGACRAEKSDLASSSTLGYRSEPFPLASSQSRLTQPLLWRSSPAVSVGARNQAAQVAQVVSGAIAIREDLIAGQYTRGPKEVGNVGGTGKHGGGVACLRDHGYENRW